MAAIDLYLLGPFTLRRDGASIVLHPQSRQVLAFVALGERPMLRSSIAGHLWPLRTIERANAALRAALWQIEKHLSGALKHDRVQVGLHSDVTTDVARFREAISRINQGDPSDLPSAEMLTADLLPDWDDEWLIFERERLRQHRLHALERLCRLQTERGQFDDAISAGLAAVAAEPLRESAQHALIAAHLAEGNRCEAVRQFDGFARTLQEELGFAPSVELSQLVSSSGPTKAPVRI